MEPVTHPRNLAAELRPALERLGFAVQVLDSPAQTLLLATWLTATGHNYQLLYTYHQAAPRLSYVSLRYTGRFGTRELLTDTHVRKVAEVRLLLLGNRRYKAARQAALDAGTLLPADQIATP